MNQNAQRNSEKFYSTILKYNNPVVY